MNTPDATYDINVVLHELSCLYGVVRSCAMLSCVIPAL